MLRKWKAAKKQLHSYHLISFYIYIREVQDTDLPKALKYRFFPEYFFYSTE